MDDLAQVDVAPQHLGQHLSIERYQESVIPCEFVPGRYANWNELSWPAASLRRNALDRVKPRRRAGGAHFQIHRQPPPGCLEIVPSGRRNDTFVLRHCLLQSPQCYSTESLVLRLHPVRVRIAFTNSALGEEPAFRGTLEIGLEEFSGRLHW